MSTLAGTIVSNVRDDIPDPVYLAGVAQPDTDGALVRAQTLYRWLHQGVKTFVDLTQWFIEDWTAVAIRANQPFYALDSKWYRPVQGFVRQWPIAFVDEGATVYPTRPISNQAIWGTWHRSTDHVEVGMYPIISSADPATTLGANLSVTELAQIQLASTAGFFNGGGASGAWLQIDAELIQYQQLTTAPVGVGVLTRGCAGTVASAHTAGALVQSLGFWIKGRRTPTGIADSTSVVEIPEAWIHLLETYLLARVRRSENEHQEARALMKEFEDGCRAVAANPGWKTAQGTQVQAYGVPVLGPLAWSGTTVVP